MVLDLLIKCAQYIVSQVNDVRITLEIDNMIFLNLFVESIIQFILCQS